MGSVVGGLCARRDWSEHVAAKLAGIPAEGAT